MSDGEVVLVVPFWSKATDMNTDSNYAYLRRVLPAIARERPGWLFVVTWPMKSVGVGWTYRDDGLWDEAPNILRTGWPYHSQMRSGVLGFDPARFDYIDSRFAPTIYWLHQVESGAPMFGGFRQSFNAKARPLIVAQHHYIIHPSLPYSFEGLFPRLWAQMGGTLAADMVVLNSQHTGRMLTESFSEYLNGEQMKAVGDKSVVLPFGLVDGRFDDALAAGTPTPDHPVFVYNHRFEGYKNPATTGMVLTDLRASGRKFEVWVSQSVDQRWKQFPVDRVVGHPVQSAYLANIAVPAINTLNSQHETFCISAQDSIALGHLLVAPDGVTFPELVPDGYPFLFANEGEQRAMLADILDHWPRDYDHWSPILKTFARERFGFERYIRTYSSLLGSMDALWQRSETKPEVQRDMDRFWRALKPGTYPLAKLVRAFQNATGTAEQSMPPRRVVREAVEAGARLVVTADADGDGVGLKWDIAQARTGRTEARGRVRAHRGA